MFCRVDAGFVNTFDQLFALPPLWELEVPLAHVVDFGWMTGYSKVDRFSGTSDFQRITGSRPTPEEFRLKLALWWQAP